MTWIRSKPAARQGRTDHYRWDIDGLRAIAVTAVILNHIDARLLPGGYLGVDVFFVISGFVITTSLFQHRASSFRSFAASFYARRCRRLVPALALCTIASGLLAWLLDPDPLPSLKTGIAALFGVSNIALLFASQDYFAPSSKLNLFTQTWSLSVEEQFYLMFPVLVWLSGLGRVSAGARRLFVACLVFSVVSVAIMFALPGWQGGAAYFLVFGRLWELGAGCMAALLSLTYPALAARLARPALGWAGFALMLGALAAPVPATVLASLLIVPPTALIILAGPAVAPLRRCLSSWPFVAVGRMSYSLYLWHWPVVSASALAYGRYDWQLPTELALTFALGATSYLLVERPVRFGLAVSRPVWSYAVAVAAVLPVGGGLLAMTQVPNLEPLVVHRFQQVPPPFWPFPVTGAEHARDCAITLPDRPLRPTTFDLCTVAPSRAGEPTIWVMGDSHSGQLQGLLAALREQEGIGFHLVETPSVPFPIPSGATFAPRLKLFETALPRMKPGDVILLARLFLTREEPVTPVAGLGQWIPQVKLLAEQVRPLGVQVVVMGPTPMFQFTSIYGCRLRGPAATTCDVTRASLAAVIDSIDAAFEDVAKRQPNLHLFSSFSVLCPPSTWSCSPVKDGIPQYRDQDHLNVAGAASLEPAFRRFALSAGLLPGE